MFTGRIGQWWPLEDLSVYGAGGTVRFTDGRIVERSAADEATVWGTVTRWEPGAALAFTWHPGGPPEQASDVEVTFTAADSQTLVTITHAGWERFADPAAARAEYEQGWPVVLSRYRDDMARGVPDADGETWVALLHRPGPAAPEGGRWAADRAGRPAVNRRGSARVVASGIIGMVTWTHRWYRDGASGVPSAAEIGRAFTEMVLIGHARPGNRLLARALADPEDTHNVRKITQRFL